jgi:ornithine--oxo-acid transaminase
MNTDEILSCLGTGEATVGCQKEKVEPDLLVFGTALGRGIAPMSTVVAHKNFIGSIKTEEHSSTFGSNPLPAAARLAVVRMPAKADTQRRSAERGKHLPRRLHAPESKGVLAVRGAALWAGISINPTLATGRQVCDSLMARGMLAKDTHGSAIRLAPALMVTKKHVLTGIDQREALVSQLIPY